MPTISSVATTRVIVKAGIVHAGRILVLTSSAVKHAGYRDLPGGNVEWGEDLVAALKREVLEETGLTMRVVAPVRVWSFVSRTNSVFHVGITFACTSRSSRVRLSAEHAAFEWLLPAQIPTSWPERAELVAVLRAAKRGASAISSTAGAALPGM
ncbi:MAG: NUDIX domain-containing protein [Gemmatimonadaceae bacterium]